MPYLSSQIRSLDGMQLTTSEWTPKSKPDALICLVHGLGEHSHRYSHWADFFTQENMAFFSFDLRGHGRSQGKRGEVSNYNDLMDDISVFLEKGRSRFPDSPQFLYGHSLGGNLVANYALRFQPELEGIILTGPMFRLTFDPPPWKENSAKLIYKLWPSFSVSNKLDVKALSHDPQVVFDYKNDPLVHDRLSIRLGIDLIQSGLWALENADKLSNSMLLMHGGADKITDPEASRQFAAHAGELCTLKIWEGLYHEIHNEPEKEQVFSFLFNWIINKRKKGNFHESQSKTKDKTPTHSLRHFEAKDV